MMSVSGVAYSSGSAVESCLCGMGDIVTLSPAMCSGVNGLTVLGVVVLLFLMYFMGGQVAMRSFRGHGLRWLGTLVIWAGFCAEGAWVASMYDAGGIWPALAAGIPWPYGIYANYKTIKEIVP